MNFGEFEIRCGNIKQGEKYIGEASQLKTENDDLFELSLKQVQIDVNITKNNINEIYNNYKNVIDKAIVVRRIFNQKWLGRV